MTHIRILSERAISVFGERLNRLAGKQQPPGRSA